MANPAGAILTGSQTAMEREWNDALAREHDARFDRLIALNNMPIARFLEWLEVTGNLWAYMELPVNTFNPGSVSGLIRRNMLSVSWDGHVFDCDFNQMLELAATGEQGEPLHIRDFDPKRWVNRRIVTGRHCFGCAAGAGSSCGGATADSP